MLQVNEQSAKKLPNKKISYVTVGKKYQIVIPKETREKMKRLIPGSKVYVHPVNDYTLSVTIDPESWVEASYGYMKDAWKNIDMIAEIKKMRNEWGERLTEQAKVWKKSQKLKSSK